MLSDFIYLFIFFVFVICNFVFRIRICFALLGHRSFRLFHIFYILDGVTVIKKMTHHLLIVRAFREECSFKDYIMKGFLLSI